MKEMTTTLQNKFTALGKQDLRVWELPFTKLFIGEARVAVGSIVINSTVALTEQEYQLYLDWINS